MLNCKNHFCKYLQHWRKLVACSAWRGSLSMPWLHEGCGWYWGSWKMVASGKGYLLIFSFPEFLLAAVTSTYHFVLSVWDPTMLFGDISSREFEVDLVHWSHSWPMATILQQPPITTTLQKKFSPVLLVIKWMHSSKFENWNILKVAKVSKFIVCCTKCICMLIGVFYWLVHIHY